MGKRKGKSRKSKSKGRKGSKQQSKSKKSTFRGKPLRTLTKKEQKEYAKKWVQEEKEARYKRHLKAMGKSKNPCPKSTTIHLKRKGVKIKIKKGALSKHLGIPEEKNIPKTLLLKIKGAKKGTTIKNPTKSGKRNIKVTSTTKKQATLALTLKGFKD